MTISDAYRAQQMELHKNPNYGVMSIQYAPMVAELAQMIKAKSISDYGAGKQNLRKKMSELGHGQYDYFPYDPAFPDYGDPKPADLVCCIDVLEHIEPDYLEDVFSDLKGIVRNFGFFTIHCGPAGKVLPDGRNAHLIQETASWWLPRLCNHFEIRQLMETEGGFWVLVSPLGDLRGV